MNIKPLSDRVLIKIAEAKEEKTAGGLLLSPKAVTGEPVIGEVVACGNGKYASNGELIPMSVKVGDKVLMSKNAGQTIKLEGEEYTLAYESEIMAVAE
ncbi:MAG: co-chaperone GroES [Oscillospiraceae bacterium]|nr:co-chaperone GroES [Oscillospiraceae bacterium]